MGYNRFAGGSIERLAALSDGLFAIAMTLLVIELHGPLAEAVHTEADLWAGLTHLAPRLLMFLMSFLTLGIFWVGQQTQLNHMARADRNFTWIHLGFLAAATLMPFTTALLGEFFHFRLAVVIYWLNILLLGLFVYASWVYAERAGLVDPEAPATIAKAVRLRIIVAQALYAIGAALSVFGTWWAIGFIFLVQLNYALAPPIPGLRRL